MVELAKFMTYQAEKLSATLAAMAKTSEKLSKLLTAIYGDCDPRTICGRELAAAAMRLKWAMANGDAPLPAVV